MSDPAVDNDSQLLARYTGDRSEDAFAELVRRHIDLVYSAALRQVRSPQLAEEVVQSVFIDLGRNAHRLQSQTILTAWLYQVTRRTAIDAVRREVRRQSREQIATQLNAMNAPDASWSHIEPFLDEAVSALDEADRAALLLRYFENKSLREVGQQLGISDDAAQKRVRRAVERLRAFLAGRGVTAGTTGLGIVISANAVQAAPVGLATAISSAVLVGGIAATSATLAITKTIAMTTLQKAIVATTLAVVAGAGLYEVQYRSRLRNEVQTLQKQQTALAEENAQLLRERDEAMNQLEAASAKLMPRLPAPQMPAAAQSQSEADLQSKLLMARLLKGETPTLTSEQIEKYLKENQRNAASLLAMFRATGDKSLLAEAMEKFPNDPRVAFDSVFNADSPDERRQRLENFKRTAPDNAMASYLSALEFFKSGQSDQAVKELMAATGKSQFQDYSWDFVQNSEEAWRSAGYSEAEIRMVAAWQLLLPHAAQLNQLHKNIAELANAYQQAGDSESAQAALQFNLQLGQQMASSPNDPLINQLIGMAIQRNALGLMNPESPYGTTGQTVGERIAQLKQQDTAIKDLVRQIEPLQQAMSPQDWITYNDRTKTFGEVNALQWLVARHNQK